MTQQELLISLLRNVAEGSPQYSLFEPTQARAVTSSIRSVPFHFIDLFAGIGGLRLGLEAVGGRCVFSSEWDRYCQRTYREWFGETPEGDIVNIVNHQLHRIPPHNVLAAGFPCQPFSIAGVSKKNALGRPHGFDDLEQGNLFFSVAAIIEARRPPAFLLENVKDLKSHDRGRTWQVIESTLRGFGYTVYSNVVDAAAWVPQHRERIFIVGFDKNIFGDAPPFAFPDAPEQVRPTMRSILESDADPKYTLSDQLWKYLQDYSAKHKAKGNGFGYGLVDSDSVSRTLSARYYKDGSEILVRQRGRNPRRLTPRECARLMGFPEKLKIPVSDTQAYKQFGNAVVPKVVAAVGQRMVDVFAWQIDRTAGGLSFGAGPLTSERMDGPLLTEAERRAVGGL
jgi:DNA (cytosine-5)-methyltransferase 1